MKIIVSIHDITTESLNACKQIIARLEDAGVKGMSLLVIPEPREEMSLEDSKELLSWLKERKATGDEIVIHGLTHRSDRPRGMLGNYYARGVAEFQTIDYDTSMNKIKKAMDMFLNAGFEPSGFVPPAWLISKDGGRAVADAGLYYTTHIGIHLPGGDFIFSPVIVFGARNFLTELFSSATARLTSHLIDLVRIPYARVALHPADIERPGLFGLALHIIEGMLDKRQPCTYRYLLDPSISDPSIKGVSI